MPDQYGRPDVFDLANPFARLTRNGRPRNGTWVKGNGNFYVYVASGGGHDPGPSSPPLPGYGLDGYPLAGTPQAQLPGTNQLSTSSSGFLVPPGTSLATGSATPYAGSAYPYGAPPYGYPPPYPYAPPQSESGSIGEFFGSLLNGLTGGGQQPQYPPGYYPQQQGYYPPPGYYPQPPAYPLPPGYGQPPPSLWPQLGGAPFQPGY